MNSVSKIASKSNLSACAKTVDKDNNNKNNIFNNLMADICSIYTAWPTAWKNAAIFKAAKRNWTEELAVRGVNTIEQLDRGISKARKDAGRGKFPVPPHISEFCDWCLQTSTEDLGLPREEDAWHEARLQSGMQSPLYSHEAIRHAVNAADKHFIATHIEKRTKPVFIKEYRAVIELIKKGLDLNQKKVESKPLDPYVQMLADAIARGGEAAGKLFIVDMREQGVELIIPRNDYNQDGRLKLDEVVVKKLSENKGRFATLDDIMDSISDPEDKDKEKEAQEAEVLSLLEEQKRAEFLELDYSQLDQKVDSYLADTLNDSLDQATRKQAARLMSLAKNIQAKIRQKLESSNSSKVSCA